MNEWKSGPINIVEVPDDNYYQAHKQQLVNYHIVLLANTDGATLLYPTKITFEMAVPASIDQLVMKFPSSKRSSINKRITDVTANYQYKFIENITSQDFSEWDKGYRDFVTSIPYGKYSLDSDWFATKAHQHIALLIYKQGQIKGGVMLKKISEKLSMSYAWYADDLRTAGGSTFAVAKSLDYASNHGYKLFSFGQDTNLYGGHLSLGLQEFKSSWFTQARTTKGSEYKSIIIQSLPESVSKIVYYLMDNQGNLSKHEHSN